MQTFPGRVMDRVLSSSFERIPEEIRFPCTSAVV
jgi:hypothetical protein